MVQVVPETLKLDPDCSRYRWYQRLWDGNLNVPSTGGTRDAETGPWRFLVLPQTDLTIPGDTWWGCSIGPWGDRRWWAWIRWHRRTRRWTRGGTAPRSRWTRRGPALRGWTGHGRPAETRGPQWCHTKSVGYKHGTGPLAAHLRPDGIPVTCSQESSTGGGIAVVMVEVLMSPMMLSPSFRAWYIRSISSRCWAWTTNIAHLSKWVSPVYLGITWLPECHLPTCVLPVYLSLICLPGSHLSKLVSPNWVSSVYLSLTCSWDSSIRVFWSPQEYSWASRSEWMNSFVWGSERSYEWHPYLFLPECTWAVISCLHCWPSGAWWSWGSGLGQCGGW